MNKYLIKICCLPLAFLALSACGGSSSDSDESVSNSDELVEERVDLSLYFFPEESKIETMQFYSCESSLSAEDCSQAPSTSEYIVEVNSNTITSDSFDETTSVIGADTILHTYEDGEYNPETEQFERIVPTVEYPRFVAPNEVFFPYKDRKTVFVGPFTTQTFQVGDSTLTEEDVIITIENELENDDPEKDDSYTVTLRYFVKNRGFIGYVFFGYCFEDEPELSLDIDYAESCDTEFSDIEAQVVVVD